MGRARRLGLPGNTTIVGSDGQILAGPLRGGEGILYAELDLARLRSQRREFDPVEHYARPGMFHLQVESRRAPQ